MVGSFRLLVCNDVQESDIRSLASIHLCSHISLAKTVKDTKALLVRRFLCLSIDVREGEDSIGEYGDEVTG